MEKFDFCKFIAAIEADPDAITPPITVRQFLQVKEHLRECDVCYNRALRVIAKEPKKMFPDRGVN